MPLLERRTAFRTVLAAGGTLAAALLARKWLTPPDDGISPAVPPPSGPLPVVDALRPVSPPAALPPLAVRVASSATPVPLRSLLGPHGAVLNLWATWCGPCRAEMPALAALGRALAPDGITVLPVALGNADADAIADFYAAHGVAGLPVLRGDAPVVMAALRLDAIPVTVLVSAAGIMRARLEGGAGWGRADAVGRVRAVLAGQGQGQGLHP